MENREPLLSIVMPIYNLEEYLASCLDSLRDQTLKDIEILCVDDGSTDSSFCILQEYEKRDSRIRVFQQKNMGAGPARNKALENARGKYIAFMDADDCYPSTDILQRMVETAQQKGALIVGGYRKLLTESECYTDPNDPLAKLVAEHPEGSWIEYRDVQFDFNYQAYIYDRKMLETNHICFPDYRRFQDPPFFVRSMMVADRFYLIPYATYTYRWGHQNIKWTPRKINDMVQGHIDNLKLSRKAHFATLHEITAMRLESRYQNILLSQLSWENLKLYALMVYAMSLVEISWLKPQVRNQYNKKSFAVLSAFEEKLAKMLVEKSVADDAMQQWDKCIDQIWKYYEELPDHDDQKLMESIACALSKVYAMNTYAVSRKVLKNYVELQKKKRNYLGITSDIQSVNCAVNTLRGVKDAFDYFDKIEHQGKIQADVQEQRRNSQKNVKLTVVIPVYNKEEYVGECLESLLRQNMDDFEIVCIDDGSTDNSNAILMKYADKYDNIIVLKQQNAGLSMARNNAVKYANGEYIHFLDSDDFMFDDSYEKLYGVAKEENLDMLFFDAKPVYETEDLENAYKWYSTGYNTPNTCTTPMSGPEYYVKANVEGAFRVSACMYLIRRQFILENDLWFKPGIVHEDNLFTHTASILSKRVRHIAEAAYGRRICEESLSLGTQGFKHAYGYFYTYVQFSEFLKTKQIDLRVQEIAAKKLREFLRNGRNRFVQIADPNERNYYLAMSPQSALLFEMTIASEPVVFGEDNKPVVPSSCNADVQKLKKEMDTVKKKLSKIEKGTWIFHKTYGGIKCLKDNGIGYTIRRFKQKVKNHLKKKSS